MGTIWHPQVPQAPKTGDGNPQAYYNGQVLGQMQGGSSQFQYQYYPHLLALSKPQKIAGAQPITKSQSGDFVLTGGGVSEIEALRVPNSSLNNKALKNLGTTWHPQVPQGIL